MRRRKLLRVVADPADRMIRESTKKLGEPIVTYIGGDLDLYCGRCEAVLVRGITDEVDLGDMLLKCPSCDALNDPRQRVSSS
jgi:uncharacterized C2H2 Zn-finger protein